MFIKKIKYCLFILLIGFIVFFPQKIYAQVQQGQWWYCLTPKIVNQYNVTVSANGLPTNIDIYIVECRLKKNGGYNCTTGNSQYDKLLNLEGEFANVVDISPSPIYRTSTGDLKENEINIHDEGPDAFLNQFYFFGVVLEEQLPEPITPQISAFYKSQQVSTFSLGSSLPSNEIEKCNSIWWDPYGRVFDSKSLEPLPNIKVTILDRDKKFISSPQVKNPIVTLIDGIFNFLVQEGVYFLKVEPSVSYTFNDNPNLNPNYIKVYKNIYKPNEPIYELIDTEEEKIKGKPNPEHRDIPLDPGNNPPYEACPQNMVYGISRIGNYTRIAGKVSHPLTKITIKQDNKILLNQEADVFGKYELNINNKLIDPKKTILAFFKKTDLTGMNKQFPNCDFSLEFEPILPYLEGYAYDANGNVIPNAIISIILDSTKKTFYEISTNSEGFFNIYSKNLPIFPYKLKITNLYDNKSYILTTSKFNNQNSKYLKSKNINLQLITKEEKFDKEKNINNFSSTYQGKNNHNQITNNYKNIKNKILTIIIISLLFLLSIFIIILFYKKNNINNKS